VRVDFPLLLAAAPLKPPSVKCAAALGLFDFPLLLAAAPLKRVCQRADRVVRGDFPLLLAAAPLKQRSRGRRRRRFVIFRCF